MYATICSFKNLLLAYKRARQCKKFKGNILEYGFFLENNLLKLHKELKAQTYSPFPYTCFTIYEPKTRRIAAPAFRDRVMQHSLVSAIEPLFDAQFIYDSYACRKKRGTHFGARRVKKFLQAARSTAGKDAEIYCLRMDIKKFFASVSWDVLLFSIDKTIKCHRTRNLIHKIVTWYDFVNLEGAAIEPPEDMITIGKRRGLPIGNLTSQLFANVYLNELDHFVKETLKIKWYGRYMDDFLIIHPDKEYLKQTLKNIRDFLKQCLQLELNSNKVIIQNVKTGIPFVGYLLFYDHVLIRGSTLRHMQKQFRKRRKLFQKGLISEDKLFQTHNSIRGHLKHANAHRLYSFMLGNCV